MRPGKAGGNIVGASTMLLNSLEEAISPLPNLKGDVAGTRQDSLSSKVRLHEGRSLDQLSQAHASSLAYSKSWSSPRKRRAATAHNTRNTLAALAGGSAAETRTEFAEATRTAATAPSAGSRSAQRYAPSLLLRSVRSRAAWESWG